MRKTCAPPRRAFRPGAALAAGLLLAVGQAEAAGKAKTGRPRTPIPSGLTWRSGGTGSSACLATLRGRALDVVNLFLTHTSFPALVRQTAGMRAPEGVP